MKKRILSLIAAVMLLCTGCGGDESSESLNEFYAETTETAKEYTVEDFTMQIDNPYVTPHSTELFYTIRCLDGTCDGEVSYSDSYVIERQDENGEWTRVPTANGREYIAFADMAHRIYGHSVFSSIPMDLYIGSLTEGHHRLVKRLNKDIELTAEFDVIPSDIGFELHDADDVTAETEFLTYSFIYQGDGTKTYICGQDYTLEKLDENGEWQAVTFVKNFVFNGIGYILSQAYPERKLAFSIDSIVHDPPLTAGRYRITAEVFNDEKLTTYDENEHLLHERFSAEFTIN